MVDEPVNPTPVVNGETLPAANPVQDTQMSNHVNGELEAGPSEREDPPRDTEMADTS